MRCTEQSRRRSETRAIFHSTGYLFLLLGLLFLPTGCPRPALPPLMQPGPETILTTETVSQLIHDRDASFQSLIAAGKIRIDSWEEKYKFSEAFVLEKPEKFRLETLGFLQQPAVFLTSNERMLSLYSKKQNVLYKGVASQENLFKLSGLNLSVEDAIRVLSGNPTGLPAVNLEWGMPLPERQQFYLERLSLSRGIVQRLWFDTERLVITYFEEAMIGNGEIVLKVEFNDYRAGETGTYPMPAQILIDRPFDNTRVKIDYNFFDINTPVEQDIFVFVPPADANIRNIDDRTLEDIEQLAPYKEFQTDEN